MYFTFNMSSRNLSIAYHTYDCYDNGFNKECYLVFIHFYFSIITLKVCTAIKSHWSKNVKLKYSNVLTTAYDYDSLQMTNSYHSSDNLALLLGIKQSIFFILSQLV